MRAVLGIVSLLVALAIVGVLASQQLKGANRVPATGAAGASVPAPASSAREAAQQMQDKVRDDLNKALDQGAARREEIDK